MNDFPPREPAIATAPSPSLPVGKARGGTVLVTPAHLQASINAESSAELHHHLLAREHASLIAAKQQFPVKRSQETQ